MFGFKEKNKALKREQKPIIVKAEIDYDKLADKLAQAMAKYNATNMLNEANIVKTTIVAQKALEDIEEKAPLSKSSKLMRNTLIWFYIIIFSIGVAGCIVYCYYNTLHGISFRKWWFFPVFFGGISLLSVFISKETWKSGTNKEIRDHFEYINIITTLFLALLALKFG